MIKISDKFQVDPSRFRLMYKGEYVPIGDLMSINHLYNIMEIAEYVLNNYEYSEQDAWNIAATAYNYMDRDDERGQRESEAIENAIKIFEENKKYEE